MCHALNALQSNARVLERQISMWYLRLRSGKGILIVFLQCVSLVLLAFSGLNDSPSAYLHSGEEMSYSLRRLASGMGLPVTAMSYCGLYLCEDNRSLSSSIPSLSHLYHFCRDQRQARYHCAEVLCHVSLR